MDGFLPLSPAWTLRTPQRTTPLLDVHVVLVESIPSFRMARIYRKIWISAQMLYLSSVICQVIWIHALIDADIPYLAIGIKEVNVLSPSSLPDRNKWLDKVPRDHHYCIAWLHGFGSHCSATSRILGSIVIHIQSESMATVIGRLPLTSQGIVAVNYKTKFHSDMQYSPRLIKEATNSKIWLPLQSTVIAPLWDLLLHSNKWLCSPPATFYQITSSY